MRINKQKSKFFDCVYLGQNNSSYSTWREELLEKLNNNVPYYDAQLKYIEDCTLDEFKLELSCKKVSKLNVNVYYVSKMTIYTGYQIREELLNTDDTSRLAFVFLKDQTDEKADSLYSLKKALTKEGCKVFESIDELAVFINCLY